MQNWLFLILSVMSIALYQNCSATHQTLEGVSLGSSGPSTTIDDIDMALSLESFQSTLFPITQEAGACVDCHGVDQQPLHSMADASIAHDIMISFGMVNLRAPTQSAIVQKLENGHQGYDQAFTGRVRDAVQAWSDDLIAKGGLSGVGNGVQPIYSSLFTNVFEAKCTSCHSAGQTAETIDYSDYVTTINTGRIVPGDASASVIMSYNNIGHEPTDTAEALTAEERSALSEWINRGALNN